jgi:hypothetical protein
MKTYTFTLILGGSPRIDEAVARQLFDAGCDDALPGVRHGVSLVDFDREANSFRDAVTSAIADVRRANSQLRVSRIEPDDLVSMSEMARRSERTRENIGQMAIGARGPGDFPLPVRAVATKSPLWSWAQAARWLAAHEKLDQEVAEQARELVSLNTELGGPSEKAEPQVTGVLLVTYPVAPPFPVWSSEIHIKKPRFITGAR